jgi:hypothetical protein
MSHTTAPTFRIVPKHVARNPVARAVARATLRSSAVEFQITLYTLQQGQVVASDATAAAKTLQVAMGVLVDAGLDDGPDARVIAGGMSCLAQLSARGFRWHTADAPAIDQALQRAMAVYAAATAQQVERAWLRVTQMDCEDAARAQVSP